MSGDLSQVRQTALDLAEPLLHGRTIFLTGSATRSQHMAQFLADAGARVVPVDLGVTGKCTRDRFDAYERALAHPADPVRATLDDKDPGRTALVYAGSFTTATSLCGRRVIGARSSSHLDAECKDRQRGWRIHAPGILRPLSVPESVLASARAAVHATAQRLHHQLGYIRAFGTDGVIADGSYTIHEINPRVSAGFGPLDKLAPEAVPLAAADLLLGDLPNAPAALTTPLAALATLLRRDPTPAYRLWEASAYSTPALSGETAQLAWTQQIRKVAAEGRLPIGELECNDS